MFVFAVVICSTVQLKAQEIEVTNSEIFVRSENNYGVLKFYNHGELLLNKNASTSNNRNVVSGHPPGWHPYYNGRKCKHAYKRGV
jgi:hypothetical protein